jgi:hypothetical protein
VRSRGVDVVEMPMANGDWRERACMVLHARLQDGGDWGGWWLAQKWGKWAMTQVAWAWLQQADALACAQSKSDNDPG